MAFIRNNLVKETSTTTGTGNYTLAGAVTDFIAFSAVCANNDYVPYIARMGAAYEEGYGQWQTGGILVRVAITRSSNGNAAVNWGAGTKYIAIAEGVDNTVTRTRALAADHTLASTTGTEVTGLEFAGVIPGAYRFHHALVCQSSATGTGIGLGINFTGTATARFVRWSVTTGTTTATGVPDDVSNNLTGAMVEGWANLAFTTTAPNTLNGGVATANADFMIIIEGILIVTALGNLELWHSSETAANTSVKANSISGLLKAA